MYDFLEFTYSRLHEELDPISFRDAINHVLRDENSAYRFVDDLIAPITAPIEIEEIETATGSGIESVEKHIERSLELLPDRKNRIVATQSRRRFRQLKPCVVMLPGTKRRLSMIAYSRSVAQMPFTRHFNRHS